MRVRLKHERLARELALSSLTLNRWAQKMGLRSGHLSELARGKRIYPRPATRQKLQDALGLSFDDLFEIEAAGSRPRKRRPSGSSGKAAVRPPSVEPTIQSKGGGLMDRLAQDFRGGFRQLRRHPGFAAAAVLTLALAIASDIALFSMVNTVAWKPFPFPDASRLTVLTSQFQRGQVGSVPIFDYWELRQHADSFEEIAAHDWSPFAVTASAGASRVGGGRVTANFFETLGVTPAIGRVFTIEEDRPGGPPVVVLSEELWRSRFGADSGIVGTAISLNGQPSTVIGVLPGGVDYPVGARLWVPLGYDAASVSGRDGEWTQITGRLRPDVSPQRARAELQALAGRLEQQFPDTNEGRGFALDTFRRAAAGTFQDLVPVLMTVIFLVLLIACANVANLLMARGKARERELAIRSSLGAGRSGVIRQLLIESSVLAGLAGVVGLVAGSVAVHGLVRLVPLEIPSWISFSVDYRVVVFAVAVSALAVLFFGAFPAIHGSRRQIRSALHEGGRATGQAGRRRFRSVLVVTEVAVSAALLVGAGLLARSIMELSTVDVGFESQRRLTVGMDILTAADEPVTERLAHFDRMQRALAAVSGVRAVGAIDRMPLKGRTWPTVVTAEGQTEEQQKTNPNLLRNVVNPDYFRAMGIPLLAGETFPPELADGQRPVVISERLARGVWPGEDPIGRRLKLGEPGDPDNWFVVRGVVADVRHTGVEQQERATLYLPYQLAPFSRMFWVVETAADDPAALTEPIRRAVASVDPDQPLHEVLPMSEVIGLSFGESLAVGQLFSLFALMALILTSIGVYGVMSYSVTERTRELGIRLALGADRTSVLHEIVTRGALLTLIGLGLGLLAGFGLGTALSSMLFQVGAFDWAAFSATAIVLGVVALLALALPAYRASRVDPLNALRCE